MSAGGRLSRKVMWNIFRLQIFRHKVHAYLELDLLCSLTSIV